MQAITFANINDLTEKEWHEKRRCGVGGSDAAAACNISRWKSSYELWLEKTGQLEPKELGEAALWGKLLEPIILEQFSQRTGLKVEKVNEILQHRSYHFMLANLDGIVIDPINGKGVFEAKTTSSFSAKEWDNNEIPDEYVLQVQHYLAVTGLQFAVIAVLIGGNKLEWRFLKRDDELITLLIKLEEKFWHSVETMTPPPITALSLTSDILKRLYPHGKPEQKKLPEEALNLITQYESAQADKYEAMQQENTAANQLKAMLGEHEVGIIGDRTVLWKNVSSERLNIKELKAALPDVYRQFVENSTYRRFSIK